MISSTWRQFACLAAAAAVGLSGCAATGSGTAPSPSVHLGQADPIQVLDRISWGVDASSVAALQRVGLDDYVSRQLQPGPAVLPAPVAAQIAAMTISQQPLPQIVRTLDLQRRSNDGMADDAAKRAAQRAYQQELGRLAKEAATRSLLRAVYSPNQLQEQMTWFWMNHFNVFEGKNNLRAMIGDYEEQAIRPHALGKFRDLLSATVHHPAMLRYLDNDRNAAHRINENYAREIMELHTLGVDGGYAQKDVAELARILTGLGVDRQAEAPAVRQALQAQFLRQGLFEFNPNRHDYGDKQFLGQRVQGRGLAEVDEAIDRLSRHPATARFVSRKLAVFFVADTPPEALVGRMAATFQASDGDIAATLRTLFSSPEFAASLGQRFKDPVHYVISAVRLTVGDRPDLDTTPMLGWLNRLGEPLYGHQTPDGYALTADAWNSSGQMSNRFEIARLIAAGGGLARSDRRADDRPAPPRKPVERLDAAPVVALLGQRRGEPTRAVLGQAGSALEWNTLFLSSPEMMYR